MIGSFKIILKKLEVRREIHYKTMLSTKIEKHFVSDICQTVGTDAT